MRGGRAAFCVFWRHRADTGHIIPVRLRESATVLYYPQVERKDAYAIVIKGRAKWQNQSIKIHLPAKPGTCHSGLDGETAETGQISFSDYDAGFNYLPLSFLYT